MKDVKVAAPPEEDKLEYLIHQVSMLTNAEAMALGIKLKDLCKTIVEKEAKRLDDSKT